MKLSLLLFCCFHGICWTSDHYCAHQPETLSVKEGDSVIIPCAYTYPENLRGRSKIIITWGERDTADCYYIKRYIIDRSGNVLDEYKDRISNVHHPDNRTAALVIQGLNTSAGITFCCRVILFGNVEHDWYDAQGTSLIFPDGEGLSQVGELIAVPGEEMVIPCHYPLKTPREDLHVTWYTGNNKRCDQNNRVIYRSDPAHTDNVDGYSLVNFPEDVSLRIHKVPRHENSHYCCSLTTSNGGIQSKFSTELTIADSLSSSSFTVTQPYSITGHRGKSVTLSCLYSRDMTRDTLGVNIYWRVDSTSGPYAYHPYKEMVHPDYRGRAEIKGAADLHIRGLQMSDNSTYYCFVMIRVCTGNEKYQKLIQYGEGTRLKVADSREFLIIISISAAVLLVLLCVILIILKITGVICKKKNVSEKNKTSDSPENAEFALEERPYCEISTKNAELNGAAECKEGPKEKMMEREIDELENENILYSEINKSKLKQRNSASYQNQEEQTIYASVVSSDSRK